MKQQKIGIIGLGYVGIPLALSFLNKNQSVIVFDNNKDLLKQLNKGYISLDHLSKEDISKFIDSGHLSFTTDLSLIDNCYAVIICVPTPINSEKKPDLVAIRNVVDGILPHLKKGQIISLESEDFFCFFLKYSIFVIS